MGSQKPVDQPLDDDPPPVHAPALGGAAPGRPQLLGAAHHRLAVARGGHDRLDHAREPHPPGPGRQLVRGRGEDVGAGGQPQLLGRQTADALAVHGQAGRPRRRHHAHVPGLLQGHQGVGGQGLDLGDDDDGAARADGRGQRPRVAHVHRQGVVRHLLGGGPLVAVDGGDLHPQARQGDGDLLAELARAQQGHAGGRVRPRRAQDGGRRRGRGLSAHGGPFVDGRARRAAPGPTLPVGVP